MAYCQMGDLRWRVDPTKVSWNYQIDTSVIETLGGQVVQVLGATLSDLTISGDLGQDHGRSQESWQLANAFHTKIKSMMDAQVSTPFAQSSGATRSIGAEATFVHNPYPFSYSDGVHNWSFQVLVKGIADGDGSGASITYTNGKFNHKYQLTLFILQADSELVQTIASDPFISRIAQGIGWNKSSFHGAVTAQDAQNFIVSNGSNITGFLANMLGGQPLVAPPSAPAPGTVGRVKAQ
jgi:hypothetical protein